jgi:hypothetical protein
MQGPFYFFLFSKTEVILRSYSILLQKQIL